MMALVLTCVRSTYGCCRLRLSYVLAYIDRSSSFAALTMRGRLHMRRAMSASPSEHLLWGLFPVRSAKQRHPGDSVGAGCGCTDSDHLGVFAGATAFRTSATSFGIVRFPDGMAEAGFFPGSFLYIHYWSRRPSARIVSGLL